jgi:hypothetical protein
MRNQYTHSRSSTNSGNNLYKNHSIIQMKQWGWFLLPKSQLFKLVHLYFTLFMTVFQSVIWKETDSKWQREHLVNLE